MLLVNETGQPVNYYITSASDGDCGQIAAEGIVDLPAYDNQTNVTVKFSPAAAPEFAIKIDQTQSGELIQMAVIVN